MEWNGGKVIQEFVCTRAFRKALPFRKKIKYWLKKMPIWAFIKGYKNIKTGKRIYLVFVDLEEHWKQTRNEEEFLTELTDTIPHEMIHLGIAEAGYGKYNDHAEEIIDRMLEWSRDSHSGET